MNTNSSTRRVEGRTVAGISLMLLAIVLFSCLNGSVKWLTQDYDPLMVVWARNMGAFAFMLAAFLPKYGFALFRTERPLGQVVRAIFLLGSSMLYFFGLSYMDMATGAAIQLTGPLMVTALSVPLLKEQVGWRRWLAVIVGFIGALIIIRPGFDMRWAALLFLASACCSTFYAIFTRYLSNYDNPATAATVAAAVGVIAITPAVPFFWETPQGILSIFLFFLVGILAGAGHFLLTSAYRYAEASTLAPFSYVHLLGAAVIGFFIFDHFPDLWTCVGASIIVTAGLYVAHRERLKIRSETISRKNKSD
jgi:drug/metabolite transporter (DMT)-like permease